MELRVLRVLIVDDEALARQELRFQLEQLDAIDIVGQAANGIQALELIEQHEPDLVFLDVQMPGRTGFDVARALRRRPADCHVVFVTAFDEYAIEGFEVNAVDYLLKPVEPARLAQAVDRARERIRSGRAPDADAGANEDLERIVQRLAERERLPGQLALKVDDRYLLVQADDIVFASLVDDELRIATDRVTGVSSYRTMDELQARLDPEVFWRVHRSHLVNINKIKEIVPWFSRNYILKMKDAKATEIPVSRAQTKRLREYLKL